MSQYGDTLLPIGNIVMRRRQIPARAIWQFGIPRAIAPRSRAMRPCFAALNLGLQP
jgi:hypothetical protein